MAYSHQSLRYARRIVEFEDLNFTMHTGILDADETHQIERHFVAFHKLNLLRQFLLLSAVRFL
jgi:hypothetical protein